MPQKKTSYPDDWMTIARKDWQRVDLLLGFDDIDGAGFFLQQAVEKYLKAFLLKKGWQLRRIHNLEALLAEALEYEPSFEKYRFSCQTISALYIVFRYPGGPESTLVESDIREMKREISELIEKIEKHFTE